MRLAVRHSRLAISCVSLGLVLVGCTSTPTRDIGGAAASGMTGATPTDVALAASAASAAQPSSGGPVVILVRHAEKGTDSPSDPTLTADGERRAQALAAALKDAGITHIITTEFRRTQLTAAPLAAVLGLTPEVVRAQGATPHALAMATAIRGRGPGDVVLVVGHSNTVPAYIAALGGPNVTPICDASHDNLYVLAPGTGASGAPRLVHARYGATSPAC